jgi:hypothetical protein
MSSQGGSEELKKEATCRYFRQVRQEVIVKWTQHVSNTYKIKGRK